MAAVEHDDVHVTVLDIGGRLEADKADARERLAVAPQSHWRPQDVAAVTQLPVTSTAKGVPEKRAYGSDYPFRDFGQRDGVIALDDINEALVSGAFGGFSNAWGAQFMPFTTATFRLWPISAEEMHRHYRPILQNIPYAAEEDDLAELFPVLDGATPLPCLSPRSRAVLQRYERHRERLSRRGVLVGRARLAMDSPGCVRCGLCMTGCPYSLVYSASQTMDELRQRSRIAYHKGLLAVRVEEDADGATVVAKELETGRHHRFKADLVLLACGAVGTSRLVMGSLELFDTPAEILESRQFMLPFLSGRAVVDPRRANDFTLNQFNMVVKLDADAYDLSLLHFYTYNPAFIDALPGVMRTSSGRYCARAATARLSVALGYLPSWASPKFVMRAHRPAVPGTLPRDNPHVEP